MLAAPASDDLLGRSVYYAVDTIGNIKIGCSRDPVSRCRHLGIDLIGYTPGWFTKEAHVHYLFADVRVAPEWFRPSMELLRYIAAQPLTYPRDDYNVRALLGMEEEQARPFRQLSTNHALRRHSKPALSVASAKRDALIRSRRNLEAKCQPQYRDEPQHRSTRP